MFYKSVYLKNVDKNTWDEWVTQIPEANYYHCFDWLNFTNNYQSLRDNSSFACLAHDGSPLAICPLSITYDEDNDVFELSSGSAGPLAAPALSDLAPSLRRKLLDDIFRVIKSYAAEFNSKRIKMIWYPLNLSCCAGDFMNHRYSFELLRYQMFYNVENTIVMDMSLSEERLLNNMGKYQRRHIKKGKQSGIEVKVYNSECNERFLRDYFRKFQEAHFIAAGVATRPQATWDDMCSFAHTGGASLFIAFIEDTPISYLYCGEFNSMAFGWTQVNVKEYEKQYSPRHLLEWEAVLYYKMHGFRFYEVGERYSVPQLFYIPTEKEISISDFKERYGGILMPKIYWTGYFDLDFMRGELAGRFDKLINKVALCGVRNGS